ncbi:MAG TPA: cupin domain-containing protein [Opitutaceae bacterium]|nr:cupin domain-containing protein [Opitutaceae bacterium]
MNKYLCMFAVGLAAVWVVHSQSFQANAAAPAPSEKPKTAVLNPVKSAPLASQVFQWKDLPVKVTPNGMRRDVFNTSTATLLNLECHVTTLLPGRMSHPPHQHAHEEIIIVTEGSLEVNLKGEITEAGTGSILFYAPQDLHGVKNNGTTNATYHVFTWKTPATAGAVREKQESESGKLK